MLNIEGAYFHIVGIRKEFPQLDPVAAGLMMWKAERYVKNHSTIIDGYPIPTEGPAILTGNHFEESDVYKIAVVARRSGRLIRAIVRRSLIVEGAVESKEYLKSLGSDATHEVDYDPIKAWVLKNLGVIDIQRDKVDRAIIRRGNNVLRTGQILGAFFQPTRYTDCILRNLEIGAALFAKLNPDVPWYPVAFSGPPHGPDKITVLKPSTYAQKMAECGRELSPEELTIMFADQTVQALPETSQKDWETTREVELARLMAPKK